jgi:hypothetical protein
LFKVDGRVVAVVWLAGGTVVAVLAPVDDATAAGATPV